MTKLAFMSDLHIDLNDFTDFEIQVLTHMLMEEGIDHLHIAGDISNHHHTVGLPFIKRLQKELPVTYHLGNHDMLDLNELEIEQLDFNCYTIDGKTFLAFHGWYDYSFYSQKTDDENLSFKKRFWFDRRLERHQTDPDLTAMIVKKLDNVLAKHPEVELVSLHFVPHEQFLLTHPRLIPFNAFLGSQQFHDIFVKHHVSDVVFGHSHHSYDNQVIDGISYHAHPLGYRHEWDLTRDFLAKRPEYKSTKNWTLSKRYHRVKQLHDYQYYTQQHLKEEFKNAMTVFEW